SEAQDDSPDPAGPSRPDLAVDSGLAFHLDLAGAIRPDLPPFRLPLLGKLGAPGDRRGAPFGHALPARSLPPLVPLGFGALEFGFLLGEFLRPIPFGPLLLPLPARRLVPPQLPGVGRRDEWRRVCDDGHIVIVFILLRARPSLRRVGIVER